MTSTRQAPQGRTGAPCWHVHHDQLVEALLEPLKNRIAYIKRKKPADERALRLRLLKRVRGKLPTSVDKAWAASGKARAASDKAWAASGKAWAAYDKAWAAYGEAIKDSAPAFRVLHAKECLNCPWDGKTIFPRVPV